MWLYGSGGVAFGSARTYSGSSTARRKSSLAPTLFRFFPAKLPPATANPETRSHQNSQHPRFGYPRGLSTASTAMPTEATAGLEYPGLESAKGSDSPLV